MELSSLGYGRIAGISNAFIIVFLVIMTFGCEDALVDVDTYGSIEGRVLSDSTGNAIADASVTTSPATEAILTDEEGRFMFDEIPTGEYTVSVRKRNYDRANVSISVREHRSAQATILLSREENQPSTESDAEVTVTNWWNETENDSTYYAHVEYRIENTGEVDIEEFELTFLIQTPEDTFYHNEAGESLDVGRSKVGEFEKFIREDEAESVDLYDLWLKEVNND